MERGDKGTALIAIFGTGIALATILVPLRLWVRVKIIRKMGPDDWVVVLSLILSLIVFGLLATSVHHGLGKHSSTLTPEQVATATKLVWTAFCFTPSAEIAAKISISLMLLRITPSVHWKRFMWTLIVLSIMVTIASFFAIVLSCQPIRLLWGDTSRGGQCHVLQRTVIAYIQGVGAALYDVVLAVSPIILLWNVQIGLRKKMLLCGLLAIGFFTSAAAILRASYTEEITHKEDPTWAIMDLLIWKSVELPLSIIVGCLPTLNPLFDTKSYRQLRQMRQGHAHPVPDGTRDLIDVGRRLDISLSTSRSSAASESSHELELKADLHFLEHAV